MRMKALTAFHVARRQAHILLHLALLGALAR
jgi:hypothetical protein